MKKNILYFLFELNVNTFPFYSKLLPIQGRHKRRFLQNSHPLLITFIIICDAPLTIIDFRRNLRLFYDAKIIISR